jgi:Cu2+-containing amine oxidase
MLQDLRYYFHKSGRLEPVLYSSGWSCGQNRSEKDHKHHPYWRLDFDIDGTNNRVSHILSTNAGTTSTATYSTESGFTAPTNTNVLVWTIANSNTGKSIRLSSPSNERADSLGSPWFGFGQRDMHVCRYKGSEDIGWDFSSTSQLGFFTPPEATENTDIVFWSQIDQEMVPRDNQW